MQTDFPYPPPISEPLAPPPPRPWGPWATVGLGAAVFAVYSMVQGVVYLVVAILSSDFQSAGTLDEMMNSLMSNGLAISLAIILAAPVGIGLIIIFIKVRRGPSVTDYLGLRRMNWKTLPVFLAIPIVLLVALELVANFIVQPSGDNLMLDAYKNNPAPVLFWLAVVIFAPAFEESLFRGFGIPGLLQSRSGPALAIGFTALTWALLHIQYDWFGMVVILVMGIILGYVRIRSSSLWGPLIIHSVWNLIQVILIVLVVNGVIEQ